MSEHFNGQYEVEFKYRITSKVDFLTALATLKPTIRFEDNCETDWFYDRGQATLAAQQKSISIRQMQPANIKLWIVKGPELERCEAVEINDCDRARSMLLTMGYQHTKTLTKTRSMYYIGEFHVTVDHIDGLGHFVEFAVVTDDNAKINDYKSVLKQLAGRCHLTDDQLELRSYKELVG